MNKFADEQDDLVIQEEFYPEEYDVPLEVEEEFIPEENDSLDAKDEESSPEQEIVVTELEPVSIEPVGDEPIEVEIIIGDLPGAPDDSPDPVIEVDEKKDENDLKSKKDDKWDWSSYGTKGFIQWVSKKSQEIPRHSGQDTAGLERAISFMEKLDGEISKAMRMDVDGELDANVIEKVRSDIEKGLNKLHDRLDKVKSSKKRKKKSEVISEQLVKEAQKITGVKGVFVTVDLLTSRIARVCVNSMVSAGHDIERTFAEQVKKYALNERERAQVIQLIEDMGYPIREDRAYFPGEKGENGDWATNYQGK